MNTVAVIGTGLMGGSFGLACLSRGLCDEVRGFDRDSQTVEIALDRKAITRRCASPAEAVAGANLVVIATPVAVIPMVYEELAQALSPGAVVTDVGSTKSRVVDSIAPKVPFGTSFIGGHPIAGSELEGIGAARADLYEGCSWILTPTSQTDSASYGMLTRFLGKVGARVLSLNPTAHDEVVALSSHLPQLLSSALMSFAADVAASETGLPLVTAGGFRDMTRIAASNPDLWVGIIKENSGALTRLLRRFTQDLEELTETIETESWAGLYERLSAAREARRALPGKPGLHFEEVVEIVVPVEDRPGILAEVTTTVGSAGVNIEDLDIVHSPEGGRGQIHLSMEGREAADRAIEALKERGFVPRLEAEN